MVYSSNGLTVGLSIGIPSFVIIVGVFLFWFKNHRKQQEEDRVNSLDLELNDNQSFTEFGEQLHKTKPDDIDIKESEVNGTTGSEVSGDTGASGEKIINPTTPIRTRNIVRATTPVTVGNLTPNHTPGHLTPNHTPGHLTTGNVTPGHLTPGNLTPGHLTPGNLTPGHLTPNMGTPGTFGTPRFNNRHSKTNSAYEFYESFIPIMPGEVHGSQSSSISSLNHLTKDANEEEKDSLDNLAKQLHNQEFFPGKIPPVSSSVYLRQHHSSSVHNSNEGLVQDAINDNYVYEPKVMNQSSEKGKSTQKPLGQDDKLASILGGQMDNSFKNNDSSDVVFK